MQAVDHNDTGTTVRARILDGLEDGNRGNTVTLQCPTKALVAPATMGAAITVVDAHGNPGADAESITITLGKDSDIPVPDNGVNAAHQALIEWGVAGAFFSAKVDWANGTILFVSADNVKVKLIPADNSTAPPFTLFFSASLSYGSAPAKSNRSRLTVPLGPVAAGASVTVPIPPFAVSAGIITEDNVQPMTVQFVGNLAPLTRFGTFTFNGNTNTSGQGAGSFPIASGARKAIFTNASAGPSADNYLIFDILL